MVLDEELAKRRAYVVFETLKDELIEGGGTDTQVEAFRFSFLILRGGRAFLQSFGLGCLYLDYDKISEVYFVLRFALPGPKGLSEEEERLIYIHNKEVLALENSSKSSFRFS